MQGAERGFRERELGRAEFVDPHARPLPARGRGAQPTRGARFPQRVGRRSHTSWTTESPRPVTSTGLPVLRAGWRYASHLFHRTIQQRAAVEQGLEHAFELFALLWLDAG